MRCPLVRGSPYLTFIFTSPGTPIFTTQHSIVGFVANPARTKYRVSFNNNQTWLIYASSPLALTPDLRSTAPYAGVIRVAVLPPMDTGAAESLLDAHAPVYPTAGNASIGRYQVRSLQGSWCNLCPKECIPCSVHLPLEAMHAQDGVKIQQRGGTHGLTVCRRLQAGTSCSLFLCQIEYNYTSVSWSPAVSATSLLMLTLPGTFLSLSSVPSPPCKVHQLACPMVCFSCSSRCCSAESIAATVSPCFFVLEQL